MIFKGLGKIAELMRALPRVKAEMEGLQQRLNLLIAEGAAGGGMVRVRVNGKLDVLSCSVSEEALRDREMLEDLIRGATTQAIEKARRLAADATSNMAAKCGATPELALREGAAQ